MDRPTRRAFVQKAQHNPPGQEPGTGHWNYVQCIKHLYEWGDWNEAAPSPSALMGALSKERDCEGHTVFRSGLPPQEHYPFDSSDTSEVELETKYDVFLSHAAEEDELSAMIAELLEASGIAVFSTRPSYPAGIWSDEVRAALEESQHLWLLLTSHALDRSVYVHHEFGYFYGYHRRKHAESDVRIVGRRLKYFVSKSDPRHPGMYQHFQAFPVDDFGDPVALARVIAEEIGREFVEPDDPTSFVVMTSTERPTTAPDGFDEFEVVGTSSSAAPDYSYGLRSIAVYSPKTIFQVSAVISDPRVIVTPLRQLAQIGGERRVEISLKVEWSDSQRRGGDLIDSYERAFRLHRPRDPGPEWSPLYVTFETSSGESWAAVTYMRVQRHAHGHPETDLDPGPNPFGWVRAER